jgi:hypothetical protein
VVVVDSIFIWFVNGICMLKICNLDKLMMLHIVNRDKTNYHHHNNNSNFIKKKKKIIFINKKSLLINFKPRLACPLTLSFPIAYSYFLPSAGGCPPLHCSIFSQPLL